MYQRRLIPPAFGVLELENELQYHGLAMRVNSAYDACMSCVNFVKFGPVTPELTGSFVNVRYNVVKKLGYFIKYLWIYCTNFRIRYTI